MKIGTCVILLGLALVAYSLTLAPYTNEQLFQERYMELQSGQSEEYWTLRDEMLTSKYLLQDCGGTAILAGALIVFLASVRWRPTAPRSKAVLVVVAIVLPFLSVAAYLFDLFQGAARGEFPHWADSLGIPLMGVPFQLVALLVWSVLHLGFLKPNYSSSASLALAVSRQSNPWLLLVATVTVLFLILSVAGATYWYAIPGLVWLYF